LPLDLSNQKDWNTMSDSIKHIHKGNIFYLMENDLMSQGVLKDEEWEPHITNFIKSQLNADSVFVDIGSNFGYHTIFASKFCKHVYGFEPQTEIFNLLKKSVEANQAENVTIFNCALGNENKMVKLSAVDYSATSNFGDVGVGIGKSNPLATLKKLIKSVIGRSNNSREGQSVEMKRLDSFQIPRVDLIKLDVQGYELFVLQGAQKLLEKSRPLMIVEFEDFQLKKFGYDSAVLFKHLKSIGYYPMYLEYKYPSDHICIPLEKLDEFKAKNRDLISPLQQNNELNNNLLNGVSEKINLLSL
jgi:FkbM family methyltransferase